MAFGAKRVETRHWKFPRQLPAVVAIHAAKRWDQSLYDLCQTEPFARVLAAHGVKFVTRPKASAAATIGVPRLLPRPLIPFGQIVAVGRLRLCIPTEASAAGVRMAARLSGDAGKLDELAFGDFSRGRWAWAFDRVVALQEPILETGHQSLWRWEPTAEAATIAAELHAAAENIPDFS